MKGVPEWTTPDSIEDFCGDNSEVRVGQSIDDNTGTWWQHSTYCYHWVIFDMGVTMTITKIRIFQISVDTMHWGLDVGLYVYVSDDPESFGDAVWEGVLDADGWQESGAFEKDGRFIKLISKADHYNQRMPEFDAYTEVGGQTYTQYHSLTINITLSHQRIGMFERQSALQIQSELLHHREGLFSRYSGLSVLVELFDTTFRYVFVEEEIEDLGAGGWPDPEYSIRIFLHNCRNALMVNIAFPTLDLWVNHNLNAKGIFWTSILAVCIVGFVHQVFKHPKKQKVKVLQE